MPLTPRQQEIARLVAEQKSAKAISRETGLSVYTVNEYIRNAAARVPGPGKPRERLIVFVLSLTPPLVD